MCSRIIQGLGIGSLGLYLMLAPSDPCFAQDCVGDCNGQGIVTVSEVILGVNISLGVQPATACEAFANADGVVTISQLVQAVNNALNGCPAKALAGISAACTLLYKGTPYAPPKMVDVTLMILNVSGVTITEVTPIEPLNARGAPFTVLDSPSELSQLLDGQRVAFQWRLSSSASLVVNAGAIATGPDGEIQIGPVVCR